MIFRLVFIIKKKLIRVFKNIVISWIHQLSSFYIINNSISKTNLFFYIKSTRSTIVLIIKELIIKCLFTLTYTIKSCTNAFFYDSQYKNVTYKSKSTKLNSIFQCSITIYRFFYKYKLILFWRQLEISNEVNSIYTRIKFIIE